MRLRKILQDWEGRRLLAGVSDLASRSKAQLHQDLWVLTETKRKRGGFFVEVGAFDGVTLSNTYLLEKEFGWSGILAEPNPAYHALLRQNRTAAISPKAIYSCKGMVQFVCVEEAPEISGIVEHAYDDFFAETRKREPNILSVEAITLEDLLQEHGAPRQIDYLSIDTEGSELEILSSLKFDAHDISLISVEHNWHASREQATEHLLRKHGFRRVYRRHSRFDGWYRRERGE